MKTAYSQVASTVGVCVCLSLVSAVGWTADAKAHGAASTSAAAPDAAGKAMQLATKYAQDNKLNWGKAETAIIHGIQVDPQLRRDDVDGTSWVFFKTPKAEEEILWKRVLIVKPDGTIQNLRGPDNKPDDFSPKKAKQIATQHAEDRKLNWGKAEREVDRKDADTYWVFFPTPKQEEEAISKRVLVVKRDGSIADPPRRR